LHNFSHAEAFEQWCAKCPWYGAGI
jgi:hypothetical protein